jgi:hypothetical protein
VVFQLLENWETFLHISFRDIKRQINPGQAERLLLGGPLKKRMEEVITHCDVIYLTLFTDLLKPLNADVFINYNPRKNSFPTLESTVFVHHTEQPANIAWGSKRYLF